MSLKNQIIAQLARIPVTEIEIDKIDKLFVKNGGKWVGVVTSVSSDIDKLRKSIKEVLTSGSKSKP